MMGNAAIQRLIEAIGYPDRVPDGDATSCTLRVDDGEVRVEVEEDRLMLKRVITSDGEAIARLAGYVPGRMLRENAVLAVEREGSAATAFLWQETAASDGALALRRFFETFLDAWDWWHARVDEEVAATPVFPDVMIRP